MNVELLTHTYIGGNGSVCLCTCIHSILGFPRGLVVKNLPASAGDRRDVGSVPGSGRSPGGGHGNPLQYSCLESSVDRGVSWATVVRLQSTHARILYIIKQNVGGSGQAMNGLQTLNPNFFFLFQRLEGPLVVCSPIPSPCDLQLPGCAKLEV